MTKHAVVHLTRYERRLHGDKNWKSVSDSFVRSTLAAMYSIKDVKHKILIMDRGDTISTSIADYRKRCPTGKWPYPTQKEE